MQSLEADLREKASSLFQAQARSKANYLEQILTHRTAVAALLAEQGQRLYEGEAKGAASTGQERAEALAAMRWSVGQDKAVRSAFISLGEHATSGPHPPIPAALIMPSCSPTGTRQTRRRRANRLMSRGASPIPARALWYSHRPCGPAIGLWASQGLRLWLDRVIEEVPREGLVERSSLLLIAPDTRFLALQSWSNDSFRWSRLPPLAFKSGRPRQRVSAR